MSKKMLIDASHPEETRVSIMSGGKIEDFDFESLSRKPLRGNIYLARITRVEPSLQAAFVEYGGNRHGFLAFNEIHPDYYQIPVSDREVLRKAEALEVELAEALAALGGDDADIDADLDEEDDGLRAVDGEVPEDDGGDDAHDHGDQAEEEEEEEEPEDGGSSGDEARSDEDGGDEAGGDEVPADFAGEDTAEDAGWHAIEEEEIAGLPKAEAERAVAADAEDETATDEAAVEAEAEAEASDDAEAKADGGEDDASERKPRRRRRRGGRGRRKPSDDEAKASDDDGDDDDEGDRDEAKARSKGDPATNAQEDGSADDADGPDDDDADDDDAPRKGRGRGRGRSKKTAEKADDPRAKEIAELERRYEDAKRERAKLLKNYRIQEVVKRRQIMLVQAVKEERGNKGAALTTYISLAGRYGVLMPNTARGGGVSRKITNASDRKRLRKAMSDLEIPQGMGLIIRTAGSKRTKAEIKRDYEYLLRLWQTIRDDTLKSVAPSLIYEEASLIKRAIRDLYDKDTESITVQGEDGYREAKDFMKTLMPSHARHVQPYREDVPLFLKQGVEQQIDAMYNPTVKLKSGGYIVIQQTEALVSVDVNSGRSTKERNVEQTAFKTNLEAADEVARQCKLRDLAGLVVIDFIDMDERKNNRAVEKRLKDAMKTDRARIQLGGISDFGLLEFSRQRKRSGIVDGTTRLCPLCEGAGHVRSVEMAAMRILRSVEEEALKGKAGVIAVQTATDVALYTLNQKRDWLTRIEATYGVTVEVTGDDHKNGDQFEMQTRGQPRTPAPSLRQAAAEERAKLDARDKAEDEEIAAAVASTEAESEAEDDPEEDTNADASSDARSSGPGSSSSGSSNSGSSDDDAKPKRRRRRGGKGRGRGGDASRDEDDADAKGPGAKGEEPAAANDDAAAASEPKEKASSGNGDGDGDGDEDGDGDGDGDGQPKKRRRRGRRGGRRNKRTDGDGGEENGEAKADDRPSDQNGEPKEEKPSRAEPAEPEADDLSEDAEAVTESYTEIDPAEASPAAPEEPAATASEPADEPEAAQPKPATEPVREAEPAKPKKPIGADDTAPEGPKRGGWWQRALGR